MTDPNYPKIQYSSAFKKKNVKFEPTLEVIKE